MEYNTDNKDEEKELPAPVEVMDRAATYRVLRFFKNISGFHTVRGSYPMKQMFKSFSGRGRSGRTS